MPSLRSFRYADAGVSIAEAGRATSKIKKLAQQTFDRNVLTNIGSFGAVYALDNTSLKHPVLVSSADGVGTKLNLAFATGIHNTVGQDLVNHCVNDVAVQGASPLFFLDYFASGKLKVGVTVEVIEGLSRACEKNGCALIGGETAEMPGLYRKGQYDLAGFVVGAAEQSRLIDGSKIRVGDTLLGLPSNGLHTNGYSLARKLLFEVAGYKLKTSVAEIGTTLSAELLKIHRSYLGPIQKLLKDGLLHGAAHITGGGITENTPRMLPVGLCAHLRLYSWPVLPIFKLLQRLGNVSEAEMLKTFNMGLGLIVAVPRRSTARVLRVLKAMDEPAYEIGIVAKGRRRVIYQ